MPDSKAATPPSPEDERPAVEAAPGAVAAPAAGAPGTRGMSDVMVADTLPTSFGTFKPVDNVMMGLPTQLQADALAQGLRELLARHGQDWCVTQVGARVEFQFCAAPPRNGTEAQAAMDSELEHLLHLALLNRGVLITPFHNMLLVCPDTTPTDVARLLAALDDVLGHIT